MNPVQNVNIANILSAERSWILLECTIKLGCVCKLCHLWLSSSTLSARAVLGVKAPISQSFTLLSTEQKLGLGDRDLARAPALS